MRNRQLGYLATCLRFIHVLLVLVLDDIPVCRRLDMAYLPVELAGRGLDNSTLSGSSVWLGAEHLGSQETNFPK